MKRVNVSGVYLGPDVANGILDFNEKALASYLARARGPGKAAKVKLPPRPAGDAARVVFREYDVPVDTRDSASRRILQLSLSLSLFLCSLYQACG